MAPMDIVIGLVIRHGFQVPGAVVMLAVGAIVAKWTGALTDRSLQKSAFELPVRKRLVRVARVMERFRERGVRPGRPQGLVRLVGGGAAAV